MYPMSDLIRQLMDARLPSEVVSQLGDYLHGQGIDDVLAHQSGEIESKTNPLAKMSMMNSGLRPNPMVNSLQLDR